MSVLLDPREHALQIDSGVSITMVKRVLEHPWFSSSMSTVHGWQVIISTKYLRPQGIVDILTVLSAVLLTQCIPDIFAVPLKHRLAQGLSDVCVIVTSVVLLGVPVLATA